MDLGKGDPYRRRAWIERAATALRVPFAGSPLRAPLKRAYESLLDRLPGDHLVSRLPGGESVRLAAAFRQVTWNPDEYRAFKADISPGDVALDVGANLGAYSLLFAQWIVSDVGAPGGEARSVVARIPVFCGSMGCPPVCGYANCDGSVLAPVLNVNDFVCFTNLYAAGCP